MSTSGSKLVYDWPSNSPAGVRLGSECLKDEREKEASTPVPLLHVTHIHNLFTLPWQRGQDADTTECLSEAVACDFYVPCTVVLFNLSSVLIIINLENTMYSFLNHTSWLL